MKTYLIPAFLMGLLSLGAVASCETEPEEIKETLSVHTNDGGEFLSKSVSFERQRVDFNITSNVSWNISTKDDWLEIAPSNLEITGGEEVTTPITVMVSVNDTEKARKGIITIHAERSSASVIISQGFDKPKYENGSIERDIRINTTHLDGAQGCFSIYLPHNYAQSGKTYPVLFLLHGMGGDNNNWINANMCSMTNALVTKNLCPEMIIVMPDGNDDYYLNGMWGSKIYYETYIYEDLIPYIKSNYPCRTDRNSWAITGLSMGGYGSVYHAFNHPDKWCFAYAMSGVVTGWQGREDTPSLQTIFERNNYTSEDFGNLPDLVLECGIQDDISYTANVETHNYLQSIGFQHEYIIRPGVHDWNFWTACYPKVLTKLNDYFR